MKNIRKLIFPCKSLIVFHILIELSEEKILFRELRPDLLPGRSLWTCEPRTDLNTMDAISAIGKKGINPAVTKPAIPSQSLKKHNLRSDRNLVVEVLPVKQVDVRPVAGTFRVWVQRLINPGAPKVLLLIINNIYYSVIVFFSIYLRACRKWHPVGHRSKCQLTVALLQGWRTYGMPSVQLLQIFLRLKW